MSLTDGDIWLSALTAKTFTELNEMLSRILNDKDRSRLVREAIRMSKSEFVLCEWESEKMEELVREESRRIDHEDGFNEGIAKGVEQGIEQGIEQTTIYNIPIDVDTIRRREPIKWTYLEGIKSLIVDTKWVF